MAAGLTRRGAPPLLRMVGGKRHAGAEDHEEPPYKSIATETTKDKEEEERLINAEPVSTDDELQKPRPRPSPSSRRKIPPAKIVDAELKQPQRKSSRKGPPIRPPAKGMYQGGKVDKAKRGMDDKEKTTSAQSSVVASDDQGWDFSEEFSSQPSPKKQRTQYGANGKGTSFLTNIHHAPPAKIFGKGLAKNLPKTNGKIVYGRNSKADPQEEDEQSDVSMKSEAERDRELIPIRKQTKDPELRTKEGRKKSARDKGANSKPTAMDDVELKSILDEPMKPTRLLQQLGDWVQDQAPPSSQPDSSAPQEALDNINDYIEQLPLDEEEGTRCSLCKEPVELEDYWAFWKGKSQTVKNHTAFCTSHRLKTAQEEYTREGYPPIEWDLLPQRIKAHRQTLYKVLNNKQPSKHRDRYEPIALTGKAAAVPSRRIDLPQHVQDELASYALDDTATYPGYYGPHGRRAITEHVMKVLKNEIKNCKDAVVQASGPAAFVQAVLVPEVAVLLIMEDCRVDCDEAEEIRERTYEMGMLLNEEIEDCLEGGEESEGDYGY